MFLITDCSQNFLWEPSHCREIQFLIFNSEARSFIRYSSSYTGNNIYMLTLVSQVCTRLNVLISGVLACQGNCEGIYLF